MDYPLGKNILVEDVKNYLENRELLTGKVKKISREISEKNIVIGNIVVFRKDGNYYRIKDGVLVVDYSELLFKTIEVN